MTDEFYKWLLELIKTGDLHNFYISTPWRKARLAALEFYHFECQRCKNEKTPSELTPATMVHHVKPVKKYPQYALSLFIYDKKTGKKVPQLIPLCHNCHAAAEKKQANENQKYPERW